MTIIFIIHCTHLHALLSSAFYGYLPFANTYNNYHILYKYQANNNNVNKNKNNSCIKKTLYMSKYINKLIENKNRKIRSYPAINTEKISQASNFFANGQ